MNEYSRPTTVTVSEGNSFKSVVADQPMTPGGRYFFQVQIKSGSLFKIGVCSRRQSPEHAFCDTEQGWAIYNGQLRHGSNHDGKKYGTALSPGDTVHVIFDTIEGTLSFGKNGTEWGVAFRDRAFCEQEFYAAVALIYMGDSFELVSHQEED